MRRLALLPRPIFFERRATMPIILWLLGVPLSLIIVLALLGVF
jgi:hypothetical protein